MKGVFSIRSIYILFIVTGQEEYIKVPKREWDEIIKVLKKTRELLSRLAA